MTTPNEKVEALILKKLEQIEEQVVALRVETRANQMISDAQHERLKTLEQTTQKTIWWVFGGAGTTLAAVVTAFILRFVL